MSLVGCRLRMVVDHPGILVRKVVVSMRNLRIWHHHLVDVTRLTGHLLDRNAAHLESSLPLCRQHLLISARSTRSLLFGEGLLYGDIGSFGHSAMRHFGLLGAQQMDA